MVTWRRFIYATSLANREHLSVIPKWNEDGHAITKQDCQRASFLTIAAFSFWRAWQVDAGDYGEVSVN